MTLSTGEMLKDRYRIEKLLGQGGYGAVYQAWDLNLERWAALKENLETFAAAQRQFKREARLVADLTHANLPKVIDYFFLEGQGQYLVMEYVEGEDLGSLMAQAGGALPAEQALPWALQVCDALAYLHSQTPPIIHRDIKPQNIRITPKGRAMLVDFGIAKMQDTGPTTEGARGVTHGYSPPEQYGRAPTDAQSDIYALGACLYHLLTGVHPPDSLDIMLGRARPLEPAAKANPAVPAWVSAALERAMRLKQTERWKSVEEFKAALERSRQPARKRVEKTEKVSQRPGASTEGYVVTERMPLSPEAPEAEKRSLPWAALGGGAGAALLAVGCLAGYGLLAWLAGWPPFAGKASPTTPPSLTQTALAEAATLETPMVLIPIGTFQMGSESGGSDEKPVHTVRLDAFYMDIYEVTNALYEKCVKAGACQPPYSTLSYSRNSYYGDSQYSDYPVIYVDWNMARAYCKWRGGDLPTEAQWEKVARGGLEGMDYPWGSEAPTCQQGARNGAQYSSCSPDDTVPVGSFAANGYGLYDMAGNVWEWVLDWYSETYYSSSLLENPFGPDSGTYRVLRGGSWYNNELTLRVANRNLLDPTLRFNNYGFRCSRSP